MRIGYIHVPELDPAAGGVLGKHASRSAAGGHNPLRPGAAPAPVLHDDVKSMVLGNNHIVRLRVLGDPVAHFRDQLKIQAVGPVIALNVFHLHPGLGNLLHEDERNLTDPVRVK